MVVIEVKDLGKIKIELDEQAAPITAENFQELVEKGFYNGLIFHRVISGFMIQGGCPEGTGMGGPGYRLKGNSRRTAMITRLSTSAGVISMARAMDPDSAGSQFFIMHEDAPYLDGQYAAFGRVVEGMDVVDEIANSMTDYNDRPYTDVVMEKVYWED
ncbi:MAG: peptidylprolyl isomerase [Christensenellaceae bacterium]